MKHFKELFCQKREIRPALALKNEGLSTHSASCSSLLPGTEKYILLEISTNLILHSVCPKDSAQVKVKVHSNCNPTILGLHQSTKISSMKISNQ